MTDRDAPMQPQPRWCVILNGKAAGNDVLREAVSAMRARGVSLDVRVTWENGDAERHVAEAIDNRVDVLVAAGGDGTLSAVATTLAHRGDHADTLPSLGLVPAGTANDFADAAGIPPDPMAAFDLVRTGAARTIDLLKIQADDGTHWCANLASGGFGTQVTVETGDGLKKMLGGLAYLITGMSKLGRIDPVQARITGVDADGEAYAWSGDFIALGIGNGRQAGGGQVLCPDALIDDGLLDLTIVPSLEGEVGATLATLIAQGRHAALDRIAERRQLRWSEIEAPQSLTLNLDGEPVQSMRFRIDCVAKRLRMHLPADCPLLSTTTTTQPP